jgi:hypothetical protein
MVKSLIVTLGLFAIFARGAGAADDEKAAEKPNQLSKEERKAGFKLLFDGKTTKGWRAYGKKEVPPSWKVVDGSLALVEKGGADLMTVAQYDNFELLIDWKVAEGGNSGIMYRVAESKGPPYVTGPEYQVLDDARHPDANKGKEGTHRAGALYDLYPPAKNVVKPAGEWNTTKIILDGSKVEHWLNGEKVVEAEIGSEDWNKRVAASKWATHAQFGKVPKGHIDLQDHGDKVEFRNIKLRVIGKPKTAKAE